MWWKRSVTGQLFIISTGNRCFMAKKLVKQNVINFYLLKLPFKRWQVSMYAMSREHVCDVILSSSLVYFFLGWVGNEHVCDVILSSSLVYFIFKKILIKIN